MFDWRCLRLEAVNQAVPLRGKPFFNSNQMKEEAGALHLMELKKWEGCFLFFFSSSLFILSSSFFARQAKSGKEREKKQFNLLINWGYGPEAI